MATPASPLAATSAPASIDSIMDSAIERASASLESTSSEDNTAVEDTSEPTPDPVESPEPEAVEGPVPEEPQPEEELDPADELQPDKVTDNGRTLHFSKQKASRLLASHDFERKVQEVIPGATPDQIAQHYQTSVIADEMMSDFDSGDPSRISKVADLFLNPQGSSQQSIASFTEAVLQRLPHVAPQIYQQFEQQAAKSFAQQCYEQAIRTNDDGLFLLAQNLDYKLSGKHLEKGDFASRDPYAEERARFQREKQEFDQQRTAERQRGQQERIRALDGDVANVKQQEIAAALKPVEAQFKDRPQWKHMLRDLTEAVDQAMSANPTWKRQLDIQKQKAIQDNTGKAAEELKAMMKNFVSRVAAQHRKGVIGNLTEGVLSANKDAHQQAAATAAKREPNGSGAPVQRTTHQQKLREAKSEDEAWNVAFSRLK